MSAVPPRPSSVPESGRFGRFEVLFDERRLRVDGAPVALGSRAFDLLAALLARRGRVVPKEELITVVWPGLIVEDNNLQVQISALRKVLGSTSIATVPGRGYQFTLAATGPDAPATPAAPALPGWPTPPGGAPRKSRLLVADDNKVNRLLLCRSLELMGHDVESAGDGRVALQRLRSEHFDMLLLDLEMPEMDGFMLLAARADDAVLRELPVIVTSGVEGAAQVARCIELGADDFLHKPVNPMLLKARVDSSLDRKHLRDRQRELLARLAPTIDGRPAPSSLEAARRVDATLLVVRLREVDALVAGATPPDALDAISGWSTLMVDAIESHDGIVIQLGGDAITAAFGVGSGVGSGAEIEAGSGAEIEAGSEAGAGDAGSAARSAVEASLEMRELVAGFNAERAAANRSAVSVGIGIATGNVIAGPAGTPRRPVHTCIGSAVQRAAALEALAPAASGAVRLDAATQAAVAAHFGTEALQPADLPGGSKAVPVHALKPEGLQPGAS